MRPALLALRRSWPPRRAIGAGTVERPTGDTRGDRQAQLDLARTDRLLEDLQQVGSSRGRAGVPDRASAQGGCDHRHSDVGAGNAHVARRRADCAEPSRGLCAERVSDCGDVGESKRDQAHRLSMTGAAGDPGAHSSSVYRPVD